MRRTDDTKSWRVGVGEEDLDDYTYVELVCPECELSMSTHFLRGVSKEVRIPLYEEDLEFFSQLSGKCPNHFRVDS